MRSESSVINLLAMILSVGHRYKYKEEVIEKRIAYSSFFIAYENQKEESILYIDDDSLIDSIFYDLKRKPINKEIYSQSLWLAELYLRIFQMTSMTFEGIFIYLPLIKGYNMYPLYHENDFSLAVNYFLQLLTSKSILFLVMKNKGISVEELAEASSLSYNMISLLRRRKKEISKVAASNFFLMASYLRIRPETLLRY